jgi:SNF2 family DNA or RNA helicase
MSKEELNKCLTKESFLTWAAEAHSKESWSTHEISPSTEEEGGPNDSDLASMDTVPLQWEKLEKGDKMDGILSILRLAQKKEVRTVVFCSWREPLVILSAHIQRDIPGATILWLHGELSPIEKRKQVQMFNNEKNSTAILLSVTKSGGIGINLQRGRIGIFLNQDFNPQVDMQAVGRLWRAGMICLGLLIAIYLIVLNFRTKGACQHFHSSCRQ